MNKHGNVLLICVALCSSCSRHSQTPEEDAFMSQLIQTERDFCSTNISIAEKGLLAHRQWLLDRASTGKAYNAQLFLTDNRLFQLCEFRGDTNRADTFYQEGAQANDRYQRSQLRLQERLSKEQVRAQLARQQRGQAIGWLTGQEQKQ